MQVWVLRNKETGEFWPPMDDDPAGAFLCWPNEFACLEGMAYQMYQGCANPIYWEPYQLTATRMANNVLAIVPSSN